MITKIIIIILGVAALAGSIIIWFNWMMKVGMEEWERYKNDN